MWGGWGHSERYVQARVLSFLGPAAMQGVVCASHAGCFLVGFHSMTDGEGGEKGKAPQPQGGHRLRSEGLSGVGSSSLSIMSDGARNRSGDAVGRNARHLSLDLPHSSL
jgi:hypothetical protein